MRVIVRLFARLRDIVGAPELEQTVEAGASVETVWNGLCANHPAIAPYRESLSVAVNGDYARMSTLVHDGDEVAFLPPVSGGCSHAR